MNRVWLVIASIVVQVVGSWRMRTTELVAAMFNKVWGCRLARTGQGSYTRRGQSRTRRLARRLDLQDETFTMGVT